MAKDRTTKIHPTLKTLEIEGEDEPLAYHFLELHRLKLRNQYPDGTQSKPYTYETVVRRNLDAVAVLLYEKKPPPENSVFVYLRRTLRPALAIRQWLRQGKKPGPLTFSAEDHPVILEVVAGLLEEEDRGQPGQIQRAVAEVREEAGFTIYPEDLLSLGEGIYPTPGMNPEVIYLFAAKIDPAKASPPSGDGSVAEEVGGLEGFSLAAALDACKEGRVRDAKTEISLHRFQQLILQGKV